MPGAPSHFRLPTLTYLVVRGSKLPPSSTDHAFVPSGARSVQTTFSEANDALNFSPFGRSKLIDRSPAVWSARSVQPPDPILKPRRCRNSAVERAIRLLYSPWPTSISTLIVAPRPKAISPLKPSTPGTRMGVQVLVPSRDIQPRPRVSLRGARSEYGYW